MKTALITGASRGIGRAIAKAFAAKDYDLHLTCRENIEMLNELGKELSNTYNVKVFTHKTDMSKSEEVFKMFSQIESLDVCVNNAGISYVGLLHQMSNDDWDRIIGTNLNSVFYTSKCATALMLKEHAGSIINISSVWGNIGASMEVAYSASKGGVNSFTKALARELAPSNISVNAIACGFVDTSMNAHLSEEERNAVLSEIPANRFATCEDIAKVAVSLAEMPSYLTGQIITVDGAWT